MDPELDPNAAPPAGDPPAGDPPANNDGSFLGGLAGDPPAGDPPAGDKPAEGDKPTEGDAAKPEGDKPAEEEYVAPELSWPEGLEVDQEFAGELGEYIKTNKLSAEQAQPLADLAAKAFDKWENTLIEQHTNTIAAWKQEIASDPLFSGADAAANKAIVDKGVKLVQHIPGVKELLGENDLGNNPVLVRVFHEIGKRLSEDKTISGGSSGKGGTKASLAEQLYKD